MREFNVTRVQELIEVPPCCADHEANRMALIAPFGQPKFTTPLKFCPWCGIHQATYVRDFSMRVAEARSKGLTL